MPPVINPSSSGGAAPPRSEERSSSSKNDLICNVRYTNELPDIPFDAKFLLYPFDTNRFIDYKATSLEQQYKFELLTEADMGIAIDLITPKLYDGCDIGELNDVDRQLLEDDDPLADARKNVKRQNVSWLRHTEYVSSDTTKYGKQTGDIAETKVGFNLQRKMERNLQKETLLCKDRDAQIEAICATFEEAKVPVEEHPTKRNVRLVEEIPVFPDFDLWRLQFAQVIFDQDPAPHNDHKMEQAIIRGMQDEEGQFVAYFLPTDDTVQKRVQDAREHKEFDDLHEYEFDIIREYNWNVKNKQHEGFDEAYFFMMKNGQCTFDPLETRVRLYKRKKGILSARSLYVTHRGYTEQEIQQQDERGALLNEPVEDDIDDAEAIAEGNEVEDEVLSNPTDNDEESADNDDKGKDATVNAVPIKKRVLDDIFTSSSDESITDVKVEPTN